MANATHHKKQPLSALLQNLAIALVFVTCLAASRVAIAAPDNYADTDTSAFSSGIVDTASDTRQEALPVSAVASNSLADPKSTAYAAAAANPGSVAAVTISEASGTDPEGETDQSTAEATARFTITDLVFTGPGAEVSATLSLAWSGMMQGSVSSLNADTYTVSNTILDITASIRNGLNTLLSISGGRTISTDQYGSDPVNEDIFENGILTGQYPPGGMLVTSQFTAPTNVPLTLTITMAASSGTSLMSTQIFNPPPTQGSAKSKADFSSTLSLPTSGQPVFQLPDGYSADSTEAGIVANVWTGTPVKAPLPVPGPGAGLPGTFLLLLGQ